MMKNVFSSGVNPSSAKLKDKSIFPYELDKFQKPIRSLTVTKTFDADLERWKTLADHEADRDLSRAEQLRKYKLDMQVDFSFNVNDVRFNSGLNADVMEALADGNEFDLVQPFVADYEMNHRQLVIYVVDCEVIPCQAQNALKFDKVASLTRGTPITLFYIDES